MRNSLVIFGFAFVALSFSFNVVLKAAPPEPFPRVGTHIQVNKLWEPLPSSGYLSFVAYPDGTAPEPIQALSGSIPMDPEALATEEDTGWSNPVGEGFSDLLLSVDNHRVAGNRVDFDWVREQREWEAKKIGQHPSDAGLLVFKVVDDPAHPTHVSGNIAHDHGGLGEIDLLPYTKLTFNRVDVVSIALLRAGNGLVFETDQPLPGETAERAAALDYDLWFIDLHQKISTHGVPEVVFVPGWNAGTWFEDYVARWHPAQAGTWNAVAIEPHRGDGRDGSCEIDAVIASEVSGP